ncbi:hypothetical protein ACFQO8_02460 [Exiguobacterium aestuarii]|uniref:Uncharacterized protein n=1 Tax=Exiguobacterium aestuarii TaxID=273527 RepID=A0ABW2PHZ0_9BACL|nr:MULTISPECIES: hypothetical protein [Exiguobacterium]MCT4787283.1 hypothetical protein [Exiguobacterium aestuarii]
MFEYIDPFLWQLVIVPFLTIGGGVLTAMLTTRVWFGPLVTFLFNAMIELTYFAVYYDHSLFDVSHLSSWNVIFPLISLLCSFIFVGLLKTSKSA